MSHDYIMKTNILLQILVLLITGISTMMQMKDHPWMVYLKNTLKANNKYTKNQTQF